MRKIFYIFLISYFGIISTLYAETHPLDSFANHYPSNPTRLRNETWPALASFVLPGFDQFWERQFLAGGTYAGYAGAGFEMMAGVAEKIKANEVGQDAVGARDNRVRQYMLGAQMYQFAGCMSGYQSFRSAVNVKKDQGLGYQFIKSDDSTIDLAWASFDLRFFLKPTSYIPLGILLGAVVMDINAKKDADHYMTGSDIGYGTAFSYQAGTSEEAFFRGWLMPSFRQGWGSDFWSNTATATLFAVAHISGENRIPVWQFAGGWYFGWLAQRNGWSIRESIFVHTWWDIIAFAGGYLADTKAERKAWLPIVAAEF